MKIAYASEDPRCLDQVGGYMRRYYEERGIQAEVSLFNDPESLIDSTQNTVYSLIILDMRYKEDSGVSLTYRIRRYLPHAPIVLMHRRENHKVECIYINPTMFVLDGLTEQAFTCMLDSVRSLMYSNPERTLLINTVQNLDRVVPVTDIIYVESMGHRVFLHLTTGEKLEMPGPIRLLADKLSGYAEFLFPHRSFVVNAFYVSCITPNALYLRVPSVIIPIARGKLENVKQAYDAYFRAFGRDTNVQNPADD